MYDEGDMNKEKRAEMHLFMVSWGIWELENNVIMQYHAMQRRRMLCNDKKEEIKKKKLGAKTSRQDMKRRKITRSRNETVNSIEQKPRERSRWQRWHEFEFKSRAIKEDHPLLPFLKQTFLKMEKHSRKRLERNFSRITKNRQTEKEIKDRQLPTHFYCRELEFRVKFGSFRLPFSFSIQTEKIKSHRLSTSKIRKTEIQRENCTPRVKQK